MELRDYLRIYWAQRWLILIIMIVTTVATYVVVASQPIRYGVTQSLAVNRLAQEATPDYQYDGYYALQAVDLFSQTVVSWFNTPAVLQDVYVSANLDPQIASLNNLPSRFHVKRYSAQNILVRFTETTSDRGSHVAKALQTIVAKRASTLNLTPDGKPLFSVSSSQAVISQVQPNRWLDSAAAAILGLFLGLLTAAARHYFRN